MKFLMWAILFVLALPFIGVLLPFLFYGMVFGIAFGSGLLSVMTGGA